MIKGFRLKMNIQTPCGKLIKMMLKKAKNDVKIMKKRPFFEPKKM